MAFERNLPLTAPGNLGPKLQQLSGARMKLKPTDLHSLRTKARNFALVAAGLSAFLGPALLRADELVPADPWQLIHVVRVFGPAEVRRDDFLDPMIDASLKSERPGDDGLPYEITFYGCEMGRGCQAVLFTMRLSRTAWTTKPPKRAKLADWNANKLIGRAWRDDAGQLVLDHAVVIGPGLNAQTLKRTLASWRTAMLEFAEHVDFPMK